MDIITITARETRTIQSLFVDAQPAPCGERFVCRAAYAIHCEDAPNDPWVVLETVYGEQYCTFSADVYETVRSMRFEPPSEHVPLILVNGKRGGVKSEYLMRCDKAYLPQLQAKSLCTIV